MYWLYSSSVSATPPKPPSRCRPLILLGQIKGLGRFHFFGGGAFGLQLGELLPEGGFQVFELHAGLGGEGAVGDTRQLEGLAASR